MAFKRVEASKFIKPAETQSGTQFLGWYRGFTLKDVEKQNGETFTSQNHEIQDDTGETIIVSGKMLDVLFAKITHNSYVRLTFHGKKMLDSGREAWDWELEVDDDPTQSAVPPTLLGAANEEEIPF